MIPGSTDGVNYYRLAAWAFEMRKYRNVIVDLLWFKYEIDPRGPHPWQEDFTSTAMSLDMPGYTVGQYLRMCIERACQLADVVVWHPVYYDCLLDFFIEMQHKHQKPFIVEIDDNYVDVPEWNEAFHSFRFGSSYRRTALDAMRNADAAFVTTPHLAEIYAPFNEKLYVVENSLDFKGDRKFVGWDRVSTRRHKGTRLGWIGGRCHFNDLMMIAPILREILTKDREVRLVLVNSALQLSCAALKRPYPFEGLKNVLYADRSVPINRYASFAASFGLDIGLAPLMDCNFNRSKSNLRWLEYSALKIPTVASNVGHFAHTVKQGITGLLASGAEDWSKHLATLIASKSFREELARNAYKEVKTRFNVTRNASGYLRRLKSISNVSVSEEPANDEAYEKAA